MSWLWDTCSQKGNGGGPDSHTPAARARSPPCAHSHSWLTSSPPAVIGTPTTTTSTPSESAKPVIVSSTYGTSMTVTVISSTGTVSSPVTTADTFIPGSSSRMGTSVPSPTPGSTTTKSSGITAAESRSASFTSFTSASATPSQTLHPLHLPPVGAIAGAVIAVLILIAGCVFLVWALHRRRRKQLEVEPVVRDNDIGTDWWQPVSHPLAAADFEHPSVSQTDKLAPNGFQPSNISSWAAAQMPRQNQILLRENEEFWDEIEDLHRENEKLRLNDSHEAYTTGNLPGPHY